MEELNEGIEWRSGVEELKSEVEEWN